MAIDDDERVRPDDLGGQESGQSVEVELTGVWGFWKRLMRWKRGEVSEPSPISWNQRVEEESARKADEAIAEACGETENQRRERLKRR